MEDEYPLHEKYDLQDVHATTYKVIIEANRQPREDEEINSDLPAYFVYYRENKYWVFIKGQQASTVEPRYLEIAYFELPLISKWKSGPGLTWNYDNR